MIRICGSLLLASSLAAAQNHFALILQDPPAAAAQSPIRLAAGPEVADARANLRNRQSLVQTQLRVRHIPIVGSAQTLVNAIFVTASPSGVSGLAAIPGVRQVVRLRKMHLALDHAEQLVNVTAAWNLLDGVSNAGKGVRIGIIDTGIDQTHPAFQDASLTPPPGYHLCQPDDCPFTTNKIIAARSYIRQQAAGSSADPAADSAPDDFSPRDHVGHGTAVAMIVAGGTSIGPSDTITGLAPKAFLGNYKIFGSPGLNDSATEDSVILALEDAVADGMDIVNLSLGGPALAGALDSGAACNLPPGVPCDLLAQAVENSNKLGVLVVAAAGNAGSSGALVPTLATVSSPGIAPSAIAVAATSNSHVWSNGPSGPRTVPIEVTNFNTVAAFSSRGPAIATASIKPEIAAVGTDLYLAAQDYDPGGALYNASRYVVSQGTSFSSPMVAGAAALVKQKHPNWQPAQIKSALVNTATQDVTDRGVAANVLAVGSGKLDVGAALAASLTVDPPTLSFGAIRSLPVSQTLRVRNNSSDAQALTISFESRIFDTAQLTLDSSTLSVQPGADAVIMASLTGAIPSPGAYQGFLTIRGTASTVRVPYLYLVSDGTPVNVIPLLGDGGIGLPGQEVPDGELALQVIDQFGLPVPGVPVTFAVARGGGAIVNPDLATNQYGIATAHAVMGPLPGGNLFNGTGARISTQFSDTALAPPTISDNGIVNAASFSAGQGIAPGEYLAIFGTSLSQSVGRQTTRDALPALRGVSVSFDVPEANLSVPGRMLYISPDQVNVQVPWELTGQTSVKVKVSVQRVPGVVVTVPVATASPGLFSSVIGGQNFAIAQDAAYIPITDAHPALRGQTIILYGTGFGPVDLPPASGTPASIPAPNALISPIVTIGGVPARVEFCGLAPGYAGLYQINVSMSAATPAGTQPLAVSVSGTAANLVMLPVQ